MSKLRLLLIGISSAFTAITFITQGWIIPSLVLALLAFGSFGLWFYRSERDRLIIVNAKQPQPTIPATDAPVASKENSLLFVPPPLKEK